MFQGPGTTGRTCMSKPTLQLVLPSHTLSHTVLTPPTTISSTTGFVASGGATAPAQTQSRSQTLENSDSTFRPTIAVSGAIASLAQPPGQGLSSAKAVSINSIVNHQSSSMIGLMVPEVSTTPAHPNKETNPQRISHALRGPGTP